METRNILLMFFSVLLMSWASQSLLRTIFDLSTIITIGVYAIVFLLIFNLIGVANVYNELKEEDQEQQEVLEEE